MEISEDEDKFIKFIDTYSTSEPIQYFHHSSTKDHTLVRSQNHALFCIIDQMRVPISLESENVAKWLIYKQSAVHRHQKFFGLFRFLAKLVRKYNDIGVLKKWNAIYKRASSSGDDMYLFENDALKYIGCAYLRRIYLLDQIREACCKCADSGLGMLEIDHWINLMLVIVAICGEVLSDAVEQVKEIVKTWKFVGNVLRRIDERFPVTLDNCEVVQRILAFGTSILTNDSVFQSTSSDFQSITKLLKFSSQKMENAQTENEIVEFRNKILDELKVEEMKKLTTSKNDMGVAISRDEFLGITNEASTSNTHDDTSLLSPTLFAKTPKKKGKKRKSNDNSFLQSTFGLISKKSK